ncbi:MAG: ABC transporter ATP-binding protein [Actinobacteria bacterium]|jgi:branched-chain amino acid transport system ATP-binding protein|nr:ABC transporter ATP-binding protein [Actinomycetota bacterium]
MTKLLEVNNLTMEFGGVVALKEVNLHVSAGEIAALIGPNGAGKTTVFNVVTGYYQPTKGDVLLNSKSVLGLKSNKIARLGLARTFQNIRLFGDMTALENVMTGSDSRNKVGLVGSIIGTSRSRQEESLSHSRAAELLNFMGISHRSGQLARNLPYGDQRRLEIARALALEPKVLLLDEPAAGFNPQEKVELGELIKKIRDAGFAVLLIEHDMSLVMKISDRVSVLDFGQKIAEGTPSEIQNNQKVIDAYLGVVDNAS